MATTKSEEPRVEEFKVIGTRPIRHDGLDKVTGRAVYGPDFRLPGMLHGKVLRSPHAHARIRSIDVSRALAHPDVRAVVTGADLRQAADREEDLGEGTENLRFLGENVLARDKVLYQGQAVAAVAAITPQSAEEALQLIAVEYEVLPAVLRAQEAMKAEAPLLHQRLTTKTLAERFGKGTDTGVVSNIASHLQFKHGDVERGFAEADLVIEREFDTASVHQGYIEPQNATVLWDADGCITVWCSSQGQFSIRSQLAEILHHPISKIRVVPLEIGGGFGGKITTYLEPVGALLSHKTGQPVKLVMSRREVFEGTGPAPGSAITVKMGVTQEGRITAAQATLAYDAGAYPGSAVGAGCSGMFAPYRIEHIQVDGYDVVVNKPKSAAYRAPGVPMAAFASETVIDELCEKLGMDPLEFRLKNGAKEGDRRPDGLKHPHIGYLETVQAALEHPHYRSPMVGSHRGRGTASGYWGNAGMQASCVISVNPDGTVSLVEGSPDIGGTRVAVAMQAAEVLGIAAEDVHPSVVDTDSIGYTGVTGGSSTAFKTGWAAYTAAQEVVRKMRERAATIWETEADEVEFSDGVFRSIKDPELQMRFKELAAQLNSTGGPISGSANVAPRGAGPAFGTHIVDVEVDPETGKVQVLRYTAVQDVGRAIHPSYVEGQVQGGVAQGIGWALNEEYFYGDEGQMVNSTFLDYRIPTSLDLPMIEAVLVEVHNPGHPYGVRGVGEVPIVPPLAAVANAIYHAVGVRMNRLPMSPGTVLEALWRKEQGDKE